MQGWKIRAQGPCARNLGRDTDSHVADSPIPAAAIPSFPPLQDFQPTHSSPPQPVAMQPTQVLQRAVKRLALTTKQTGKGYYKGTRSGAMGRHTSRGTYEIEPAKVRTYVVPKLKGFEVRAPIFWHVRRGSLGMY